jgi:hypothetical protein
VIETTKLTFSKIMGGLAISRPLKFSKIQLDNYKKKIKSYINSKVKISKIVKKKFFPEKLVSKIVFDTRVVEKLFFELVALCTKKYAVICVLF